MLDLTQRCPSCCLRATCGLPGVLPLRKFYTEQMFVLVRIQLRIHVDTQPMKRFKC